MLAGKTLERGEKIAHFRKKIRTSYGLPHLSIFDFSANCEPDTALSPWRWKEAEV